MSMSARMYAGMGGNGNSGLYRTAPYSDMTYYMSSRTLNATDSPHSSSFINSGVHTSVLTLVGVLISVFAGDIISRLDGVHCCNATLVDSAVGLMSASTKFISPHCILILSTCTHNDGVDL